MKYFEGKKVDTKHSTGRLSIRERILGEVWTDRIPLTIVHFLHDGGKLAGRKHLAGLQQHMKSCRRMSVAFRFRPISRPMSDKTSELFSTLTQILSKTDYGNI
jgi:hypothetical protein